MGGNTGYSAFGDLVVRTAEGEQVLNRRRERDTLAVLLAVRAPVSADRLLTEVWESGAALGSLQAVVSRLRNVLEPARTARGENRCLVSSSAGYSVRAEITDVDTWHFEDLARRCLGFRLQVAGSLTVLQLLPAPEAGLAQRRAAARRAERATGSRRPGVGAVAELHRHLLDRQAQRLGRDLREDGV